MDPSFLCKVFFSCGIVFSIGGTFAPNLRSQILTYGSRSKSHSSTGLFRSLSLQVPHSWFTHYYMISVASSIFWLSQFLTHGSALRFLASMSKNQNTSLTLDQVSLAWLLLTIQGLRRLYESSRISKPSQSQMWIGIWAIGILYYIFMGISVWIEGIAIFTSPMHMRDFISISRPTFKTIVALILFAIASSTQHAYHKHLASLKKYTLPNHFLSQWIVCPHYTSECLIYIAIALISAPPHLIFNGTVLAGLVFVIANLAVTADATKTWYQEKFGAQKVKDKWRMIPLLY